MNEKPDDRGDVDEISPLILIAEREGLNQSELAKKIGISQPMVSRIQAGFCGLSIRLALRIANEWPVTVKRMGGVDGLIRCQEVARIGQ